MARSIQLGMLGYPMQWPDPFKMEYMDILYNGQMHPIWYA